MARVLFVHIRKDAPEVAMPHLGLASLAAVLKQAGHEVVVFDQVLYPLGSVPPLESILAQVVPDVVGFTTYTSTLDALRSLLPRTRTLTNAPLLVGGPHATLFAQDLANMGEVDYIVQGEAEGVIADLIAEAERQDMPQIITGKLAAVADLPWPDYTCFLDFRNTASYPLMTSRGCPYRCTFCGVHRISSHRWRPRRPEDCVAELWANLPHCPHVKTLNISDDCPTGKPENFKQFLRLLAAADFGLPLQVDNMRADLVDAELMGLLKTAGAGMVCFGVESGNPEVFVLVNKGETHDDIRRAARLAREAGLQLALCFVIGLPGDTPQRHRDSIAFARELAPELVYWNMAHPFPGTEMYRWFSEQGAQIDPPRGYTSYDGHSLVCAEPTVSTPDFTREQRCRAYFEAVIATDQYLLNRQTPAHLLRGAIKYGLLGPALCSFGRRLGIAARRRLHRA